jgi:quercetin dioxygenase-like cupin family protein
LLAHQSLGALDGEAVYWSLYIYPDLAAAQNDKAVGGVVVQAFNKIWVFSIGSSAAKSTVGEHIADVGPIPVEKSVLYDAEFLKSTFSPGMVAPVHVHSGPEAFYAISGATCLETPQGVQVAKGAGNRLVVPGGAPMLLMAVGPEPRQGFALILHNREHAPTTLVNDWTPKNLCRAALP